MFENIVNFFKKLKKTDQSTDSKSKETAKERLHLVLMQDRANVSADFLELMKQEIIEVIKKYTKSSFFSDHHLISSPHYLIIYHLFLALLKV